MTCWSRGPMRPPSTRSGQNGIIDTCWSRGQAQLPSSGLTRLSYEVASDVSTDTALMSINSRPCGLTNPSSDIRHCDALS